MTGQLELLLLTDVHHGPSFEAKAGPRALEELRTVLRRLEDEPATLLLDLGDRINNAGPEQDLGFLGEVADAFETSTKERHHLLGNHDVKLLSADENARALRRPVGSRVLRRDGWTLVLWSPPPRYRRDGCAVPEEEVAWLSAALDAVDGPTAVFSHVPFHAGSMRGNYYFEGDHTAGAGYQGAERLQELLLANENVKVAVAGHVHWNSVNVVDGVPFLTVQSVSELATTSPAPAGAWARLRLEPDAVAMEVLGRDRFHVRLPLRQGGRHWLRRPGLPPWRAPATMSSPAAARGVILDLDGVVYRGDEPLAGAVEFVAELRSRGTRLVAVSNHAGASAADLAARLRRLGVPLDEREVVTSIDATVAFLLAKHPPAASALVVGSPALKEAVAAAGYAASPPYEIVVVGYQSGRDEAELAAAAAAVEAGAALVGTNSDRWLPSPNGARRPETGPYLALVASMAGRAPAAVLGKPNPYIGGMALERLGLGAHEVVVVGDTLDTDVGLAKAMGAASALLLTGNTRPTDLLVPRPDFVYEDLAALTRALADGGEPSGKIRRVP